MHTRKEMLDFKTSYTFEEDILNPNNALETIDKNNPDNLLILSILI